MSNCNWYKKPHQLFTKKNKLDSTKHFLTSIYASFLLQILLHVLHRFISLFKKKVWMTPGLQLKCMRKCCLSCTHVSTVM